MFPIQDAQRPKAMLIASLVLNIVLCWRVYTLSESLETAKAGWAAMNDFSKVVLEEPCP